MYFARTPSGARIHAETLHAKPGLTSLTIDNEDETVDVHLMDRANALDLVRSLHVALELPPIGPDVK